MPFIQTRITSKLSTAEKDSLRAQFLKIIGEELNKPAGYIMIGIEDGYALSLGESLLEKGAMISVQHMGVPDKQAYQAITKRMSLELEKALGIRSECIYITFQCINDWGWSGQLL